jgi:hypothetical protein
MSIASLLRHPAIPPATLAGRFAAILSLLIQTIALRYTPTPRAPLAALVIPYLQRTMRRLARLIGAVAAGHPPRVRPRRPRPASGRRTGSPPVALPRTYGWLLRDLRHEAAVWRNQLEALLETDDARSLLAAAPRAARLLRPLCRMLALKPALLYPPKPPPPPEPEPGPGPAAPPPRPVLPEPRRPRVALRCPWRRLPVDKPA